MKRKIGFILALTLLLGFCFVLPTGRMEAEAATKKDIVGSWSTTMAGQKLLGIQFDADGTGCYMEGGSNKIKEFNYTFNGKDLVIGGKTYYCSIVENGMITNLFGESRILERL